VILYVILLGAVHKRRPQSRGRGCPVRTFFGLGGRRLFRCGRPHFFAQKKTAQKTGFFEIYGVSAVRTNKGGGGVEPVRSFYGQGGRRSIFRDFVRISFMDGPLQLDLVIFLKIFTSSTS